eukprot:1153027-Pelagomonas_calceolata.AAC.3
MPTCDTCLCTYHWGCLIDIKLCSLQDRESSKPDEHWDCPACAPLAVPTTPTSAQAAATRSLGRALTPFVCAIVATPSAILFMMTRSCSNSYATQCNHPREGLQTCQART